MWVDRKVPHPTGGQKIGSEFSSNKGRSLLNLNDAIKLRVLENPRSAQSFSLYVINGVIANFVLKFQTFHYRGNKGRSQKDLY